MQRHTFYLKRILNSQLFCTFAVDYDVRTAQRNHWRTRQRTVSDH